MGPVCGVPVERRDANAQLTAFQSDNYCRPTQTSLPLGGFEIRSYPGLGDPSAQHIRIETPSATEGDGSGNDYTLEYFDGLGRPYKLIKKGTDTRPTIRKDTTYNARGSVSAETAPYYDGFETPKTTTFTLDSLDRLTASTFPDNAQVQKAYGIWRETVFDEHGHPTTTQVDAYGRKVRLEQVLNSQALPTIYTYDLLGRMTGIIDALGIQWSWTFDSLGRNTSRSDPDSGSWTFQYDDAGRVKHQTDAKGQQTDFDYDTAGRLSSKVNSAGTVTIGHSEARAGYFNVGRTTSVTSPGQILTMDYDKEGRALKQSRTLDGAGYVTLRRYDTAGRLRGITYPDGEAIGTDINPLAYDRAGRLHAIPGILAEVVYDAAGRPTQQTAANLVATQTSRTYSDRGLLTDIVTTAGTAPIQNLHYTLDVAGQVASVSSPEPNEGWDYVYDELHRLTSATSLGDNGQSQTFQYDAAGRMTYNSMVGTYSYPPNGWGHTHGADSLNGSPYGYDANGNVTAGGGRNIMWNADNLVSQVTKGSNVTAFTYDGLGDRVRTTTAATNSTSLYPSGDEYEVTNGVITKYVSAAGLGVVAKKVGGTTFWLHTDRLGSIQAVTDGAGSVVQRRTYRPYGDKIADATDHIESRGYIDQRQDAVVGLTYLHARFYDPSSGLFLSPDPIGPTGGLNEYGYGFGNPVNQTDRSGLYGEGDPTTEVCMSMGSEVTGANSSVNGVDISNQVVNWIVCTSLPRGGGRFPGMLTSPMSAAMWDFRVSNKFERQEWRRQQQAQAGATEPGPAPAADPNTAPDPTLPDQPDRHGSLVVGINGSLINPFGGSAGLGIYFTPGSGDFGVTGTTGAGLGKVAGVGASAAWTYSLRGFTRNVNASPVLLPIGFSVISNQSGTALRGGMVTYTLGGVPSRPGASLTIENTNVVSIPDELRRMFRTVYDGIMALGEPSGFEGW